MKLILHICCAPCTVYPQKRLAEDNIEIYGYFFNPNIHPYQEYEKRVQSVERLSNLTGLKIKYEGGYGLREFIKKAVLSKEDRCSICYYWRLESAAKFAKGGRFDAFSSTLLYSKYQKHDLIKKFGEEIARKEGIPFYYEDFRAGWSEGIKISKEMGLYRQQYCGCIYSEEERYTCRRVACNTPTSTSL